MNGWSGLIVLPLAQAHLTYLLVESSLALKVRPRLPKLLQELFSCPVCTGFWVALALSKADPVLTLAVGFLGSVAYELKARYAPCLACKNQTKVGDWKVS